MAVLGTSTADPGFYQRQASRTGDALSMIFARLEERRERKKQEELADIDRFFKVAENYPEIASTWGATIKQKYGGKHPGVSEMVDLLTNRHAMADAVRLEREQAKSAWLENWKALNQGYQQQGEQVAAMPSEAAVPFPDAGGGWGPYPNFQKQAGQQALARTDPRYFSRKALEQLPPQLQVAAADYLKTGTAFEPPPPATIFDPYKNLPTEQQALFAGLEGRIPEEGYQAARVKLGLEVSPSRKAFEQFQVSDREDRQTYDTEDREDDQAWRDTDRDARDRQMTARISYQDSLSRAREGRRAANERGLIDYRASKKVDEDGAVSWDALVRDSRFAQKDWDAAKKAAVQGLEGQQKKVALVEFYKTHGKDRPRALSETQARRMARELNAKVQGGELTLEEAEDQALDMTSDIMAGDSFPAARAANRERSTARGGGGGVEGGAGAEEVDPRAFIRQQHPEWTPDQVEEALRAFQAAQEGQ